MNNFWSVNSRIFSVIGRFPCTFSAAFGLRPGIETSRYGRVGGMVFVMHSFYKLSILSVVGPRTTYVKARHAPRVVP